MQTAERTSLPIAAVAIIVVGGAIAIIGSVLTWFKATITADLSSFGQGSQSFSQSGKGLDIDGVATLIAAVVAIAAALLVLILRDRATRTILGIVAILGGLVAAGFATYDLITGRDQILNGLREAATGVPIDRLLATGLLRLDITPQFGIFMVIAGGVIAIIGGVMLVLQRAAAEAERAEIGIAPVEPAEGSMSPTAPASVEPEPTPAPPAPAAPPESRAPEAPVSEPDDEKFTP
jgi:Tryptophan-associated transmembrane protein (Trp_oprn_chp)